MKRILLIAITLINILKLNAQECGTDKLDAYLKRTNPTYAAEMQKMEQQIYSILKNKRNNPTERIEQSNCQPTNGVFTIPIVVHVMHLGEPVGTDVNISDAQIIDAVRGLNERWRKVIGDGVDLEIQFALAVRDPNGNATTGINRINASNLPKYAANGVSINNDTIGASQIQVKQLSSWTSDRYINIWVVNNIRGGIAGYAYPLSAFTLGGIILDYNSMNYFNSTLAHEMGHVFYLAHTFFGDGSGINIPSTQCPINNDCLLDGDRVCDTPPHKQSECSTTVCSLSGDLNNSFKNYMSYCGSGSTTRFTAGQKERARTALFSYFGWRLISSPALIPTTTIFDVAIDSVEYTEDLMSSLCNHQLHPKIRLKNLGTTPITSVKMSVALAGNVINTNTYPVNILSNGTQTVNIPTITFTSGGAYDLSFQLLQINNSRVDSDTLDNQLCTSIEPIILQVTTTTATEPLSGGTFTGSKSYTCNGIDTLKVSVNTGYNLIGIYGNIYSWDTSIYDFISLDTISYYPIEVSEFSQKNITFIARFELKHYGIFGYPSPSNNYGSVFGGGEYDHGTPVALLARPRTGYKFVNWTKNGLFYSADSILSFNATENLDLLALFTLTTGIKQTSINEISKVYPNPANDILQIEIRSKQATSITLNITDIKGSLLETKTITNTKSTFNTSFDVSKLAKGNYVLNLYDEDGMASYKFVVQ